MRKGERRVNKVVSQKVEEAIRIRRAFGWAASDKFMRLQGIDELFDANSATSLYDRRQRIRRASSKTP